MDTLSRTAGAGSGLLRSFAGCAHNAVPLTQGFYFPDTSDSVPESELSVIESLSHNLSGDKYEKVQHGDHWDFVIADRLYHVTSQCCEKDCLPSKAGAYIFGHGSVSGLRHRKGQEHNHHHASLQGVQIHSPPDAVPLDETEQNTKLYVEGICCSSEARIINDLLTRLPGVLEVDVAIVTKTCSVKHSSDVTPQTLVTCLNAAHLDAYLEPPRRHSGLRTNYLPRWNILLAGVFLIVSLFYNLEKRGHNPKVGYMKWIALGTIVLALPRIALKGLASLKRLRLDINFLMTVAVAGALAIQEVTEAGIVVFLFSLADWLESACTSSARRAIEEVLALKPETAVLAHSGGTIPAKDIEVGALLLVKPGEKVAVDGIVTEGRSDVDQSLLTGESKPVRKAQGDEVLGGTVNRGSGILIYRCTQKSEDSAVARMASIVEQAIAKQSHLESIVTRFATWFTPAVILACILIIVIPIAQGTRDRKKWVNLSLQILVTACPCALVLSTPVTVVAGLATSARQGVLIKGGQHLEALAKVKTVTLDKTGTLTLGCFQVNWSISIGDISQEKMMSVAGSLERFSTHPIASCILAEAVNNGANVNLPVSHLTAVAGLGLFGLVESRMTVVGNRLLLDRKKVVYDADLVELLAREHEDKGATLCFVAHDGKLVGAIAMADIPRIESAEALTKLKALKLHVKMLTGDTVGPALSVADSIGLPREDVYAALMPEDKLAFVGDERQHGPVLHLGDGINDAPALAAARVGMAMGTSGSAIALESGDITIFTTDLRCIGPIIQLGCAAERIIYFNIAISVISKVAVLVLAALGMFTLWGAILVDVGAACLVCLNGMRCLCWDIRTGSIWNMPWRRTGSRTKIHHSHSRPSEDLPKPCCNTVKDSCKGHSPGQPIAHESACSSRRLDDSHSHHGHCCNGSAV